jgi:RimJ/RimL family protein N-acetyltransferase
LHSGPCFDNDDDYVDYDLIVMGQMPDADIEVGYFLKPSAWGQGYATEVCKRILQFAF